MSVEFPLGLSESQSTGTVYTPNTTAWEPGAYVVHDSDYKGPNMLKIVLGVSEENGEALYVTKYVNPNSYRKNQVYKNRLKYLHHPRRFRGFEGYVLPEYSEVLTTFLNHIRGGTILSKWDVHFLRMLVRLEREGAYGSKRQEAGEGRR